MTLRPYQHEPVEFLSKRKRALIVAPAGSGKTLMAAAAVRRVVYSKERTRNVRVGWIANTKEQVNQAYKSMVQVFFNREVSDAAAPKVWDEMSSKLIDSLPIFFNARCYAAGADWSCYDALIVDEAHHGPAKELRGQIETCKGARWGFTATPEAEGEDADERNRALEELFAPRSEWHYVQRSDVGSLVSKAKVILLDPEWQPGLSELIDSETEKTYAYRIKHWGGDPQKLRAMVWWQKCVEFGIVLNANRTLEAVEKANDHTRNGESVLVLVNQVEHAKEVADLIGAVACYSGMGAKARRHALYDFKAGKLKCIVATSLCDEGVDFPIASVLVLISGGKSRARTEQRTGRVLRQFVGKTHGFIYDFVDSQHALMYKHFKQRLDVYKTLGYEIENERELGIR